MPSGARKRPGLVRRERIIRPSATDRGYDYHWQQARREFLRKNPLCTEHLRRGRLVVASVVDHVRPHRGNYERFWDDSNWQSLCKECHDKKTVACDGGLGHARTETTTHVGQIA